MSEIEQDSILGWLRQPEYTGENRCLPCTMLNVGIAGALGVLVGLYAIPLGIGVFLVGVSLIYVRGYLVPYTPELTKRYLPARILRLFDKEQTVTWETDAPEEMDVEEVLHTMDVIQDCEEAEDWCLDPDFEQAWQSQMGDLEATDSRAAAIAQLLGVDADRVSIRDFDPAVVVRHDGTRVGQWESDAALVADIAANAVLEDRQGWRQLDPVTRGQVLNALRMFLEACPVCQGPATLAAETVESCCRSIEVAAVSCEDCGARIFEVELAQVGLD